MSRDPHILTIEERALKSATKLLIDAVGGPSIAAEAVGCVPSLVSSWGSVSFPDRFIHSRAVLILERLAQRPIVSKHLVEAASAGDCVNRSALAIDDVVKLALETAQAKTEILSALSDGELSAAERRDIRERLDDVAAVLADLARKVEQP